MKIVLILVLAITFGLANKCKIYNNVLNDNVMEYNQALKMGFKKKAKLALLKTYNSTEYVMMYCEGVNYNRHYNYAYEIREQLKPLIN